MPNVSQVPTIFSFQRIDFWPGWHPLHARNSALEVILPSLLSNLPSSFSSTESLSPLQLWDGLLGPSFTPRTQGKSRSRSSSRGLLTTSSRLPLCAPKFLLGLLQPLTRVFSPHWHLRHIRHQNTKTSLYKLSKNGWVCAFFIIFIPSDKYYNLQSCWITL